MNLGLNCRHVMGPVCFPSSTATFIPLSPFQTWIFPSSDPAGRSGKQNTQHTLGRPTGKAKFNLSVNWRNKHTSSSQLSFYFSESITTAFTKCGYCHTFASNRWFVSLLRGDPTQCSTVLPKRLTTTIADLKRAQVTKWGAKTTGSLHSYIQGQKLSAGTTVHRSAHFRHRISVSLRVQTNESISSEGLSDLCQIPEASLEMSAPHIAANKTGCSL